MIRYLFLCAILLCLMASANLKPLCEEEPRYIQYRCLFLERSVSRIEDLVTLASQDPDQCEQYLDMMQKEVHNCKCALGI